MKKLILYAMLTLWSMTQHASRNDFQTMLNQKAKNDAIKNSEPYKKETELFDLLHNNQNKPDLLEKIATLLQEKVNPDFSTRRRLGQPGSAIILTMHIVDNHELALNLMNLFFEYDADPNLGFKNESYENVSPLELLFMEDFSSLRKKFKISPLTDDQKIKFIKKLLRNGASIFNTPNAQDKGPLTLDQEPLMLRARQELQKEESLALQSLIQEGPRKNVSLFNVTRKLLGLSTEEFE